MSTAHGIDRGGGGSGLGAPTPSPFVQTLLDDANAAVFLTTLGLDTDLINASISTYILTLLDDTTAPIARGTLGFPTIAAKGDIIVGSAADTLTKKAVGTDGYQLQPLAATADGLAYLPPPVGFSLVNGHLDWSVLGNALTASVKTQDGADPTASNPVYAWLRDATAATGSLTLVKITTATTATLSSGSTAGTLSSKAFRIWAVLFNDGGTLRLGLINCLKNVVGPPAELSVFPLQGWGIASSTAEGGAGAADSAHVFYTGTAVSSKSYVVIGYATWETGLATAGTWDSAPTREHRVDSNTPLPGQIVQTQRNQTGAVATGTTIIPFDDTIPQSSEGDQYLSQAITPTSAANLLVARAQILLSPSVAVVFTMALFQDSTPDALSAIETAPAGGGFEQILTLEHQLLATLTSSTTFKIRAGGGSPNTTTFNGRAGARVFGGVLNSYISVQEVMG